MRITLLLLVLTACSPAEPELAGPDAGDPPPDPDELVWVQSGDYDVEWTGGPALSCDELTIGGGTYELAFPCREPIEGRLLENCRIYPDGDDDWILCPNIGYLAGERRDADNHVVATFRAYPR